MSIVQRVRSFLRPQPSPWLKFAEGINTIFQDICRNNPEAAGVLFETGGGLAKATLVVGATVAKHGSTMLAELAERASIWLKNSDQETERAVQAKRVSEDTWAKISAFDTAAQIKAFEADEADYVEHHRRMHGMKRVLEYQELEAKVADAERARAT